MLQEYLNDQLIQTSDDANFEKLKKTCSDVAKKIGKDKPKIMTYALVAFDPNIPVDNAEITEIQNEIIDNWQTFVSNSKDTLVTVIRAVMLEALQTVSSETNSASLIWFACRNVVKHYKLGREEKIIIPFLISLGNRIEGETSESWRFSPDKDVDIPKWAAAIVDEKDFSTGVTAETIKTSLGKAFKKQTNEWRESQKEFAKQVILIQMRTHLLWWKEAGYSVSARIAYRDMNAGLLHFMLAYDYSNFIPEMYPLSVDYFLVETLKSFSTLAKEKITILTFIDKIKQNAPELKNIIPEYSGKEGRISFINFIRGFIYDKLQISEFKNLVGVTETTELTYAELTLWIFHDLHAIKLSTNNES